ncbi:hypothetical protein GCM10009416_07120 [Craurococcus roseus]|uniref:Uncharacterized protein n=1 Tax=Craurococcus roseus TaxID=77585 RepID=A0ABN1EPF0_9PROT
MAWSGRWQGPAGASVRSRSRRRDCHGHSASSHSASLPSFRGFLTAITARASSAPFTGYTRAAWHGAAMTFRAAATLLLIGLALGFALGFAIAGVAARP